jgi:hypothetical protein
MIPHELILLNEYKMNLYELNKTNYTNLLYEV